jgi:hypothetical protein
MTPSFCIAAALKENLLSRLRLKINLLAAAPINPKLKSVLAW